MATETGYALFAHPNLSSTICWHATKCLKEKTANVSGEEEVKATHVAYQAQHNLHSCWRCYYCYPRTTMNKTGRHPERARFLPAKLRGVSEDYIFSWVCNLYMTEYITCKQIITITILTNSYYGNREVYSSSDIHIIPCQSKYHCKKIIFYCIQYWKSNHCPIHLVLLIVNPLF